MVAETKKQLHDAILNLTNANKNEINNLSRGLPEIMYDIIRGRALIGCFPDHLAQDQTMHFLFLNIFCMIFVNFGILFGGQAEGKENQNSLISLWQDIKCLVKPYFQENNLYKEYKEITKYVLNGENKHLRNMKEIRNDIISHNRSNLSIILGKENNLLCVDNIIRYTVRILSLVDDSVTKTYNEICDKNTRYSTISIIGIDSFCNNESMCYFKLKENQHIIDQYDTYIKASKAWIQITAFS